MKYVIVWLTSTCPCPLSLSQMCTCYCPIVGLSSLVDMLLVEAPHAGLLHHVLLMAQLKNIHTFQHQINMSLWYILFLLSNDSWTPINFLHWYALSFYLLFFLIIYDIYHSTIFIYFFSISISLKMFIGIWMSINHFLFLYSSPAILIRPNKNISRS